MTGVLRQRRREAQAGITLVELLVVILLIAVLAGIGWAGMLGAKRGTGLVGGTQLVEDLVRQARHTAISSGAPVTLLVRADERDVVGVSQIAVFAERFERHFDAARTPRTHADPDPPVPGIAGYGWVLDYPGFAPDAGGSVDVLARPLERGRRLMRRPGDGFHVSCWVRPPPVAGPNAPPPEVTFLPLVIVGTDDDPNADSGFVALGMDRSEVVAQVESAGTVAFSHWAPVAWLWNGTDRTELRGVREGSVLHDSVPGREVLGPIVGDRWIELGVLYDGHDLVLYRDGVEIAHTGKPPAGATGFPPPPGVVAVPPGIDGFRVFMGRAGGERGFGMIDEVRVHRLGADRPARLPAGVRPDRDYRIVVSEGHLALHDGGGTRLGGALVLRSEATAAHAQITIGAAGTVSSRIVEPAP